MLSLTVNKFTIRGVNIDCEFGDAAYNDSFKITFLLSDIELVRDGDIIYLNIEQHIFEDFCTRLLFETLI
jgi:hypothetical protein